MGKAKKTTRRAKTTQGRAPDRRLVAPAIVSPSALADHGLAADAIRKQQRGERPTVREADALRRLAGEDGEVIRFRIYETIPKKHWCAMSGRQTKTLNEQAERYGIPFGGRVVHLPSVVKAFHDFLAANARRLVSASDDTRDPLLSGPSSPALERYRDEKARLAQLDRLEREKVLMRREDVHTILSVSAARYRQCGELLLRRFGADAATILSDALDDVERTLDGLFGDGESGDGGDTANEQG